MFKYSLRNCSVTILRSKYQLILAMTFIFFHAFHLKFTINANFVYIPVEATFSMSILCPNDNGQYFSSWSVGALTVS